MAAMELKLLLSLRTLLVSRDIIPMVAIQMQQRQRFRVYLAVCSVQTFKRSSSLLTAMRPLDHCLSISFFPSVDI